MTNDDCISRQEVINLIDSYGGIDYQARQDMIKIIKKKPSIKPKTGNWKRIGKRGEYAYICSQCNNESMYKTNFCPNCGADMKGEE